MTTEHNERNRMMILKPTQDNRTYKIDDSECQCLYIEIAGHTVYIDSSMEELIVEVDGNRTISEAEHTRGPWAIYYNREVMSKLMEIEQ